MRTKNVTRDVTKSSSQKQASIDSTTKKSSQRSSKRHKKVSSSSSSSSSHESSDDEKPPKAIHSNISKNGSPEADKPNESFNTSKSPSKTKGNTKHSVAKSRRSTSSKQTHKKEELSRTSSRKARHRGQTDEDAQDSKTEDTDEKTNKGKSKSKNKSKNDKQPQIQDVQTKSDSEISENVQVTLQSPQANIDIPVDNNTECDENDTNAPPHEICDVPSSPLDESNKNNIGSDLIDFKQYQDTKNESDETIQNVEEDSEAKSTSEADKIVDTMEWQSVEQEIVLEMVPAQSDSDVLEYQEEVSQPDVVESSSNGTVNPVGHVEVETQSRTSSPETGIPLQIVDEEIVSTDKTAHAEDSNNTERIPPQSDEDSTSVDAIILHENSNTPPRDNKFNLTQSFDSAVRHISNVNDEIQGLKDEIGRIFETPIKSERKHKWGNSLAGLELIKPSLKNITIDTIKEFCPNVAFLEESEIRLATEHHREKKVDRRVSMETKSDDGSHRYDTQSSYEDVNIETDNSNIIALNRKISIVEDTASKLRPPPSPARNPVSSVLYISNLVRPFTLKQLKELLERTGRIKDNGFWTDHIKSKCYVHYGSSEEAEATRNALHGVNWPIGNGKQLVIEYTTPDDFEKARNPAPTPATPEKPPKVEKENLELNNQVSVKRPRHEEPERIPRERERNRSEGRSRNWDAPREERERPRRSPSRRHSRPREVRHNSRERNDRRHPRRTPTPPDYRSKRQKVKEEEPQKLMDDLFHKTKAVPSVYWLPLTPEEISTKQQERLLRMAEHKRRIEESTRIRGDHGRGAPPHRRRYD